MRNEHQSDTTRDIWRALLTMLVICALIQALSIFCKPASGQSCRVHNAHVGWAAMGSGTLIHATEDGREGMVITCYHLFTEGVGKVTVTFPGGKTHGAKLVVKDSAADLAMLRIGNPPADMVAPVDLHAFDGDGMGQSLTACGFGGQGQQRCIQGKHIGNSFSPGRLNVAMSGQIRFGDSGGGLYDGDGNFVGVCWGADTGETVASIGYPLERIFKHVFEMQCRDGRCNLTPIRRGPGVVVVQQPRPPALAPDRAPPQDQMPTIVAKVCQCQGKWDVHQNEKTEFVARIDRLEELLARLKTQPVVPGTTGERGEQGPPGEPGAVAEIDTAALIEHLQGALTHSAVLTFDDGRRKTQTKPLSEPLEFVRRDLQPK